MMISLNEEKETRDKLLSNLKKEVKKLMEEAVTKKFVHEESSCVLSVCSSIEACLLHGLKRRTIGLFKSNPTMALIQKISKTYEPAEQLVKLWAQFEEKFLNITRENATKTPTKHPSVCKGSKGYNYLWIRLALLNKSLHNLIEYIVSVSDRYYAKFALVSDPVDGFLLSSLLVGPCTLEYTKLKTCDHLWSDPNADELVKRHRMHSFATSKDTPSPKSSKKSASSRPLIMRYANKTYHSTPSLGSDEQCFASAPFIGLKSPKSLPSSPQTPKSAKDYVESLHQNSRSCIIYGKNHVTVYTKEENDGLAGYLSLHVDSLTGLTLKWTPNQLMNGSSESDTSEKSQYWLYALSIDMNSIVYIHCHRTSVILVGQDGIQHSPICFPAFTHLYQFLTCLETGLLPNGSLDPPLSLNEPNLTENSDHADLVFRILSAQSNVSSAQLKKIPKTPRQSSRKNILSNIINTNSSLSSFFSSFSSTNNENSPLLSLSLNANDSFAQTSSFSSIIFSPLIGSTPSDASQKNVSVRSSMKLLCDHMRNQIITRAFMGWLSHCRHMRTIRLHLSDLLIDTKNASASPTSDISPLTQEIWSKWMQPEEVLKEHEQEFYIRIHNGGVDHKIRREVWPYLLKHYTIDMSKDDRLRADEQAELNYRRLVDEWRPLEALVRLKDTNGAKKCLNSFDMTTPVTTNKHRTKSDRLKQLALNRNDSSISNDVFMDDSAIVDEFNSSIKRDEEILLAKDSLNRQSSTSSFVSCESTVDEHMDSALEDSCQIMMLKEDHKEILDTFASNIHLIDKDVNRCDRNYWYFQQEVNLQKLRNVIYTYMWDTLSIGYIQGMCDLLAPLLVIFDNESLTYSCFKQLMTRMGANFPHGCEMDKNFERIRSLIEIFNHDLYEHMQTQGEYGHYYFTYRWLLLDFKREFAYSDVFLYWETIWSAQHINTQYFSLFIALALVDSYKDIIMENDMDSTDTIKFFNEMAEKHQPKEILQRAREFVTRLGALVNENN